MEFLSHVRTVKDDNTLMDSLAGRALSLGFYGVAYFRPSVGDFSRIKVQTRGYPEGWADQYMQNQSYVVDPYLGYVAQSGETLQFDRITDKRELSDAQAEFVRQSKEAGLTNGFLVPALVAYPMSTFGMIPLLGWIAFRQVEDEEAIAQANIPYLEAIAQAVHKQGNRIRNGESGQKPRLSPREIAILNWIAKGKTNGDIATILEIASPTVATYVRRLFKKLDVVDRASAAVVGMRLGLIPH